MSRRTLTLLIAAASGALFGAGLLVAGMTRPEVVIGFLDASRGWDPSLAFVMAGALGVYAATYVWIRRRGGDPWFGDVFHLPTRRDVDTRLVVGAALFGIGWGLAGVCPGPALVSAISSTGAFAFVAEMIGGMMLRRVAR